MPTNATAYTLHRTFDQKIANFPDTIYKFRPNDHLTHLMRSLLEDPGVGQLLKIQTVARLSESLEGTQYSELDYFFGSLLTFPRLPEEMYSYDPFVAQLTADQWREVDRKDAQYRERLGLMLRAVNLGGTQLGLSMAAEAACGFKCVILESWRYNENLGTNQYAGRFTNTGHTYDPIAKEVLVVPQTSGETLDNSRRRSIYLALAKIKPANTVITVDELGLAVRTVINIRHAVSASEYFEIRRYVTGVNLPDPPLADRYFWAEDGVEQEAPTFAHLQTMEAQWQQNKAISSIETVVIDPDTLAESTLSPRIDPVEREWGDWRAVELADSPDNYPDGKFSGDPSKRAPNGDYMYAWTSQDEYVDWLTEQIEAIGGEILEDRYRLPVEAEPVPTVASSPSDSLAADAISISTTYYTL